MMTTDSATDAARALTDLADRTPVEIDTALAALDAEHYHLTGRVRARLATLHNAVGDRAQQHGRVKRYALSDEDAVARLRAQVDAGTVHLSYRMSAPGTLADYDAAVRALADNRAEFNRLDAEYERRRWSRFVIVQHVHSGYWCVGGTVRRTSVRQWLPEYSGRSEAEAIAELAGQAHILCTHCFPNAPVVTVRADPTTCTCKTYDPDKPKRTGFMSGNWATCPECGTRAPLTSAGNLRKHHRLTLTDSGT